MAVEDLSRIPEYLLNSFFNRLIIDSLEFNESGFKEIVNDLIKKIGFSNTFKNVLLPLLNKLGVLWTTGEIYPANEHFLSSLVTRKISSSIDQIEINSLNKLTLGP